MSEIMLETHHSILSQRYEYLWEDGVKYKRPTKLPAPEYVDALMSWAQNQLDDDRIFPNQIGALLLFLVIDKRIRH